MEKYHDSEDKKVLFSTQIIKGSYLNIFFNENNHLLNYINQIIFTFMSWMTFLFVDPILNLLHLMSIIHILLLIQILDPQILHRYIGYATI